MNPHDAAHNLAKALRESAEFKELKEAQKALKDDGKALEMLLDLRKEQLNLQKQKLSGIEVSQEQEEKLEKLFEVVSMNMIVKRYIDAEYRVIILLQDVHKAINEATSEAFDDKLMGITDDGDEEA